MPEAASKSRILLVDDHPLVRESLTSLINQQPDLEVCGEAEDSPGALRALAASQPDIAILDISLKDGSGLDLIKAMRTRASQVGIIVLSMHDEKLYAERAIRAGARGYVMKRESTRHIISAIRQVLDGKLCVSDAMAASFAERFVGGRAMAGVSPLDELSDRELEVFKLLGIGRETREVAQSLNVSIKTVQAYCARIKQKLGLANASELVREAIRWQERSPEA